VDKLSNLQPTSPDSQYRGLFLFKNSAKQRLTIFIYYDILLSLCAMVLPYMLALQQCRTGEFL